MSTNIEFSPTPRGPNSYRLARIQMPADPNIEEGFANQCDIFLGYERDPHRRGYYLTMLTCSTDGTVEKHSIFADPYAHLMVESTKRFSRKKLEALVVRVQISHLEQIEAFVARTVSYYENKGKAA